MAETMFAAVGITVVLFTVFAGVTAFAFYALGEEEL
jgi:hypothetical protein